ncbi:hypothetical protein AWB82_05919 [Caballeronia glebae]|uniref:Uncharacterized protein n=1 Tax=Caballeronia glebae TaxID=1777143 RepID=A0A158CWM8_9BURK|nr:hypothetical protein AWB82_05919 [Caballeronia glebae]
MGVHPQLRDKNSALSRLPLRINNRNSRLHQCHDFEIRLVQCKGSNFLSIDSELLSHIRDFAGRQREVPAIRDLDLQANSPHDRKRSEKCAVSSAVTFSTPRRVPTQCATSDVFFYHPTRLDVRRANFCKPVDAPERSATKQLLTRTPQRAE